MYNIDIKVKNICSLLFETNKTENNIYNKYPILFRACHVKELNPKLNLSEIQGRSEINSYNGNVLHMTNSYFFAKRYENTNRDNTEINDKNVCIVTYDTNILFKYGNFESDKEDGYNTKTPIESLQKTKCVRWECFDNDAQEKRLSAILFIEKDGIIYWNVDDIPNNNILEIVNMPSKFYLIQYNSLINILKFTNKHLIYYNIRNIPTNNIKLIYSHISNIDGYITIYNIPYRLLSNINFKIYEISECSKDEIYEQSIHNLKDCNDIYLNMQENCNIIFRKLQF